MNAYINKGTRIIVKKLLIVIPFLIPLVLLQAASVRAEDAVVVFTNARNAFEAGAYEEAATRFNALLDRNIDNDALIIETHKYLGVCYIFLEDEQNAESEFLSLLNMDPDFKLDPLVFPIDVVDFFTSVQRKHSLRLEKIARAKNRAEEERKKAELKKRQEEIERLRTNVYYEKKIIKHSKLVAMMPFGAGQFQNGHRKKGIVFLSSELFLVTSSIVTYALHESLRTHASTPFYSTQTIKEYERLETVYRISNLASVGALSVMVLVGIVDSIYHFKPQTVEWHKVDEKDIPKKLQQKHKKTTAFVTPFFERSAAGLGAIGFF